MNVNVKFFASLREKLGISEEILELSSDFKTIDDVYNLLISRGGVWIEALGNKKGIRVAVEREMAEFSALLSDGCEVAFFPPVTGG
tara:strand:+ start:303 stop:560 length:258 start_codon:yes stop_codon:yes gene_type:complete